MHYYQWNIADYALHASHLTPEEDGIYRRLLDHYYDTEMPIPKETHPVIRRLRLETYSDTVGLILKEFFVLQDDGWHNLRADEEIELYNKKAETARENGKKGGRPKKNKHLTDNQDKTTSVSTANQEKTGSKANHKPLTNNHKPLKKNIKKRFIPPSVEDVKHYCCERGNNIDPQFFVDQNTQKGWVVGKNQTPMKDWKAAVRTWEKKQQEFGSDNKTTKPLLEKLASEHGYKN